jgi:hypothetical protein
MVGTRCRASGGAAAPPYLDRVIQLVAVRKNLRQRPARRQRRPRMVAVRKHLGRHDADHVAPLTHQRTMLVLPSARLHGGRLQRPR